MAVSRRLGEMMRVKCLVRCLCSLNGTHRCHPQNYLLKENLCQEGTGTKRVHRHYPRFLPLIPSLLPVKQNSAFTYSLDKYTLNSYRMPGTLLGLWEDTSVSQRSLLSLSLHSSGGRCLLGIEFGV